MRCINKLSFFFIVCSANRLPSFKTKGDLLQSDSKNSLCNQKVPATCESDFFNQKPKMKQKWFENPRQNPLKQKVTFENAAHKAALSKRRLFNLEFRGKLGTSSYTLKGWKLWFFKSKDFFEEKSYLENTKHCSTKRGDIASKNFTSYSTDSLQRNCFRQEIGLRMHPKNCFEEKTVNISISLLLISTNGFASTQYKYIYIYMSASKIHQYKTNEKTQVHSRKEPRY